MHDLHLIAVRREPHLQSSRTTVTETVGCGHREHRSQSPFRTSADLSDAAMLNIGTVVIAQGDAVPCDLLTDRDIVARGGERRIMNNTGGRGLLQPR